MEYFGRCLPTRPSLATGSGGCRSPLDGLSAELGAGVDVELPEDVGEVCLDRRLRDEHPLPDLGVGESLGDELDHLQLGRGERLPAASRPLAGAARAARPFERVVNAELGAFGAGGLVSI